MMMIPRLNSSLVKTIQPGLRTSRIRSSRPQNHHDHVIDRSAYHHVHQQQQHHHHHQQAIQIIKSNASYKIQIQPIGREYFLTCLIGLPSSFLQNDIRRFTSNLVADSNSLKSVINVPDLTIPWNMQSSILVFSNPASNQELEENLKTREDNDDGGGRSKDSTFGPHKLLLPRQEKEKLKLMKIQDYRIGFNYLKDLVFLINSYQHGKSRHHHPIDNYPSAQPTSKELDHLDNLPRDDDSRLITAHDDLHHPRSGLAVLLSGLPVNSNPIQIENTLVNFGFPVHKAQHLNPFDRAQANLFWPILDPYQSSSKPTKLESTKAHPTSRLQLIYTPSHLISNFVASELNRLKPTWLGTRLSKKQSTKNVFDDLSDTDPFCLGGWCLKARVIY